MALVKGAFIMRQRYFQRLVDALLLFDGGNYKFAPHEQSLIVHGSILQEDEAAWYIMDDDHLGRAIPKFMYELKVEG